MRKQLGGELSRQQQRVQVAPRTGVIQVVRMLKIWSGYATRQKYRRMKYLYRKGDQELIFYT